MIDPKVADPLHWFQLRDYAKTQQRIMIFLMFVAGIAGLTGMIFFVMQPALYMLLGTVACICSGVASWTFMKTCMDIEHFSDNIGKAMAYPLHLKTSSDLDAKLDPLAVGEDYVFSNKPRN